MKKIIYIVFAIAAAVLSGCRPQVVESQSGLQLTITTDQNGYVDKIVKSGTGVDINAFIVTIARKRQIEATPPRAMRCISFCIAEKSPPYKEVSTKVLYYIRIQK